MTSSVRVAMSNRPVISNSSVSSFAIEIWSARSVMDRLADGPHRLREILDRVMAAARSPPRNGPRRRAGSRGVMKPSRISARNRRSFGPSRPMMPKSTAHQSALRIDEQVSGMHVGMEEAVAQRMAAGRTGSTVRPRRGAGRARRARAPRCRRAGCRRSIRWSGHRARSAPSRPSERGNRGRRAMFSAISDSGRRLEAQVHLHRHRARAASRPPPTGAQAPRLGRALSASAAAAVAWRRDRGGSGRACRPQHLDARPPRPSCDSDRA